MPKLYIGPMSKNVVDATIEFSNEKNIYLGFCISRRQIDYDGGYVNNWTTKEFAKYIKKRSSNILVCRDHGGPSQGRVDDDGLTSLKNDVKFANIIHIDPWRKFGILDKAVSRTAEYIEFCDNLRSSCLYEVGTEESIRQITPDDLYVFLRGLKTHLGRDLFGKIVYAVIQSGTSLEEDRNIGSYDELRLKRMVEICKDFSILSKEHNSDYLSGEIIKEKFNLGLGAINIAPEFGIIETLCILNRLSSNSKAFKDLYRLCYESGKWRKWVGADFNPDLNKKQTVKICCHYIFSNKKFKNIISSKRFNGIEDEIKFKIKNRINDIVGCA
jgi:hypothetical protein